MVLDGHVQAIFAIAFSPNGCVSYSAFMHYTWSVCLTQPAVQLSNRHGVRR